MPHILCSDCFNDEGLRRDAARLGKVDANACITCGSGRGKKLDRETALQLAHDFFVRGTIHRTDYGAAPVVQFNDRRTTEITVPEWLEQDLRLISQRLAVGFFYYGPRLWMVGEVEPLKSLQQPDERKTIIPRILSEYPCRAISPGETLYRVRIAPHNPALPQQYDSPPLGHCGMGRLDSEAFPVLYASQDLDVCIHECRATVDDEVYVATLEPTRPLRLLDLSALIKEDVTEFESLDLAIHMLFLAGKHAYEITRSIAISASKAGFDGLIYPSYFSLVRTGAAPLDTIYGISIRRIPELARFASAQTIENVAVFGRPIQQGLMHVRCINRVVLNRVDYDLVLGPVGYE